MEKALGYDPEKKTWIYFVCDVATSVLYLAAFVALKIPKYTATIGFFIPVPWLFLAYKWGGRTDRRYFSVYGVFGLFLGFVAIGAILSEENPLTDWAVVLIYIAFHALAYAMYVLHYHGQYSRQISPQLAEGT
jgi:hypothetical protein